MFRTGHIKKLTLVGTLILMALLVVGCTPTTPDATPTVDPGVGVVDTPIPDVVTSITILIPDNPVAFNGINTDTGYEQALGELVMLSLAEVDPNGIVIPELAAEIPTIENGGVIFDEETWSMTVTWKLREDVYWADGEQVNVDDVIFTWDIIVAESYVPAVDYTDSVVKIDEFTFVVNYCEGCVFPNYRTHFGGEDFFIYAEHYCDAEQGFYEWDCDDMPLSSGPYILEEWVADDHLTFVRNPNYYEPGKPAIDRVIVQIVPEESVSQAMMLRGDADLHYWPAEPAAMVYMEPGNGTEYASSPTERWIMQLIPNLYVKGDRETPHPFLSDKRVRQALRMAIDVDTILDDIFLGLGNPVWTEYIRPPFDVCGIPRPAYDPAGAAALLLEAGWEDTDGDGINECHGCPNAAEGTLMTMEFAIYAEYGDTLELAQQLIAENWGAIGVGTELQMIEGAIMWAEEADGGTEIAGLFEMDMWDDGYPGTDPSDYLWYAYHSESDWNYGWWANDDADAMVDELFTLYEEDAVWAACELAAIVEDELPRLLLFSVREQHGISERLQGVLPSANDPVTWNIADWTLTE